MNTDDRVQITELADRVRRTGAAGRDPEAADLIRRAFGDPEHAMYVLVQAVLMQEQALRSAQQRIQDLQAHQSFADPDAGRSYGSGYDGAAGQPGGAAGGSFLRTAAGVAAGAAVGVAGGALLAHGVESLFEDEPAGHDQHGGAEAADGG